LEILDLEAMVVAMSTIDFIKRIRYGQVRHRVRIWAISKPEQCLALRQMREHCG